VIGSDHRASHRVAQWRGDVRVKGTMRRLAVLAFVLFAGEARAQNAEISLRACEGGDASACASLGSLYETGSAGLQLDYARAYRLYERGCRGGAAFGCASMGRYLERGVTVPVNVARAATMYESACNGGYSYACGDLGRLYVDASGVARDVPRGVALLVKACDAGHAASCATLGRVHRTSALDLAKSAHFEDKACQLGVMFSCAMLAEAYHRASGVPRDEAQAQRLSERACAGGENLGCSNIALPRLAQLREGWCSHDNWNACMQVGGQYEGGNGVPREASRAATFYELACTHGNAIGCYSLADLYRKGTGVHQSDESAASYDRMACTLGLQQACRSK